MLHMRHPYEMGGAYWIFNMAYTQISIFVVLSISPTAEKKEEEEEATGEHEGEGRTVGNWVFQRRDLWVIAIVLTCGWIFSIVSLMMFSEVR